MNTRSTILVTFVAALWVWLLPPISVAAPGDLDLTFGGTGKVTTAGGLNQAQAHGMALQSDGKILVAGYAFVGGYADFALVRYNSNGSLDTSFNGTGRATTAIGNKNDYGQSVALQSDGKIVVAGYYDNGSNFDIAVVRYNANGSLDTTFNGTGKAMTSIGSRNDYGYSVAVQGDGKIVVAGESIITGSSGDSTIFAVVRYNPNGSLDTSFNGSGKATTAVGSYGSGARSVAVQNNGKIVVLGSSSVAVGGFLVGYFTLVRYNADGSLDTSFSGTGTVTTAIGTSSADGYSVALQNDGKIVAAGYAYVGGYSSIALARYNANGSLDTGFNGTGKVTTTIGSRYDKGWSVALQNDGKIVVAGTSDNGLNYDVAVVRYNANGSLDTTFNGSGKVTTPIGNGDAYGFGVALQNDGKIVVAGYSHYGYDYGFAVARYLGGSLATIAFYHQPGGGLNPSGHAFVALAKKNGATLFGGFYCIAFQYGFLPIGEWGFSGYIDDDWNTAWDYKISYPITDAQYNSALSVIAHDQQSPPPYNLIRFNCMDWVMKVATAAGIHMPQSTYAGIANPDTFGDSLTSIGNGYTYMGGLVASNPTPLGKLLPLSSAAMVPFDYGYSGLESAGHAAPATLAASIGIPYDHVNLGTVNVNSVDGLSLTLAGADANYAVISIKWGDGSALQEQSLTFSHVYLPGTYTAHLLVIDAAAIHSYDMTVVASTTATSPVGVNVNVAPMPPVSIPNQGLVPLTLGPDFLVMQATSIAILANGHAVAKFLGIPTLTYTIEATSDLNLGFLPVGTGTAGTNGTFQYEEAPAANAAKRFYRARFP